MNRVTRMGLGENVKKNKKAKTELPEEIIREEILTRLPIKSVVRFKSVCKPWLSLFSDPIFVKDHLTRNSTQNPNDYDCLVAYKNTRIVILSHYKETLVLPSDDYVLVGSVQGLVSVLRGDKLSLWNPAIHQSKEFTLPSQRYGHLNYIGIGFQHASNDYKVVVCCLSDDSWYTSVYSVDSDAWSHVFTPDNVFPKTNRKEYWHAPKTMVKDCPYWTCPTYTNNRFSVSSLAVVKFHVQSNEFKLLPKFHFDASGQGWPHLNHYELVSLKDCLTLMVCERSKTSIVDVYSLHEEGCQVWSKMYSVGPLDLYTHYAHLSQGFRYGAEIVCHNYGKFFCYDQKTGTIKRLLGTTHMNLLSSFTYVPSLVYLKGMKSVHVQTQTRMSSNCFRTPRRLMNSLRH